MPFVRPKAGLKYRHPQTRALVPDSGFLADEHDLDTVRGLACGDLEECDPPVEGGQVSKKKTDSDANAS